MNNLKSIIALALLFIGSGTVMAQPPVPKDKQKVRTVTIPISIFTKKELREDQQQEFIQADRLIVKEDKDEQEILSIRNVADSPLQFCVLIQDDLTSSVNLQLKDIADFIRGLPRGSRVMVGYIRGGSLQIRQKFTDDLEKAAKSLRIVGGTNGGGNGPYGGLADALKRFEALPSGRRAVLMVSDGLDVSQGTSPLSVTQTIDIDRAIARAHRLSVAVYSIYSPSAATDGGGSLLGLGGQGALLRVSDETGGRAFFQGTLAPLSFMPFFKDMGILLNRQFALTYLSTHMKKGYYRVEVTSTNPEIKIEHPKGYYYR